MPRSLPTGRGVTDRAIDGAGTIMGINRQKTSCPTQPPVATQTAQPGLAEAPCDAFGRPTPEGFSRLPGRLIRRARQGLPIVVTAALLGWILYCVPLGHLARAFVELDWLPVVAATVLLVACLYFWDGVCLWWLFSDRQNRLSYRAVLHARGTAYLGTVVHLGLGQGLLAWLMGRRHTGGLIGAAGRCLLLLYVDLGLLLALGMIGAAVSNDPRTDGIAAWCAAGVLVLGLLTAMALAFPAMWRRLSHRYRWGVSLASAGIGWRKLLPLYPLRLVYFVFGLVHAAVILALCGVQLDHAAVVGVIPLTSMLDGLPISIAGLGTREAVFLTFLEPEQPALLVAGSLLWWVCVLVGRTAIGLAVLWFPLLFCLQDSRQVN